VESVEVMMTARDAPAAGAAGKGVASDFPLEPEKNKRTARPPMERPKNLAGKGVASDFPLEPEKNKRIARPPMERPKNLAGTSRVPAKPLQHVIDRLQEPIHVGDDLEHA
jgi:hypothetical protein